MQPYSVMGLSLPKSPIILRIIKQDYEGRMLIKNFDAFPKSVLETASSVVVTPSYANTVGKISFHNRQTV